MILYYIIPSETEIFCIIINVLTVTYMAVYNKLFNFSSYFKCIELLALNVSLKLKGLAYFRFKWLWKYSGNSSSKTAKIQIYKQTINESKIKLKFKTNFKTISRNSELQ